MRQSWSEIRRRAHVFAEEWQGARYEKGETQSFYNEFFEVFGVKRRQVASFEEPVKKLGGAQGFIDLFWKGTLLVEHKSAGRDLKPAKQQAFDYFPGLKPAELPRYVLLSDFQTFELCDLDKDTEVKFALWQLPDHIEDFAFILGVELRVFRDQDPVNIEASELMGRLHDAILATGYGGHDLERLLVRLLFCLFADDTGIFGVKDSFHAWIADRTRTDGSDLGPLLMQLFEILNTPEDKRQSNLDEELRQFPYINGSLFAERLPPLHMDGDMRALLIVACEFDWSGISPAIFGALFQSVMNAKERRKAGAHYTTERNILKLIQPLFLDELRAEFERLKARRDKRKALEAFHDRLARLTFFDPACGCGNFLIIAYRELPGSGGTLDYVTAWFLKAGAYMAEATDNSPLPMGEADRRAGEGTGSPARANPPRMGFVATNSITQGEQVAQLWPLLFDRYRLEIAFAHRTFAWGSDARGKAHVHVVIVGLTRREDEPPAKRLFSYKDINGDPAESTHAALTPYLFDAANLANRHLVVQERSRPLCNVPPLVSGTQPIDDGNYIFDATERQEFLAREPQANSFMVPFLGAEEYINGIQRWILNLRSATPMQLREMPLVAERMRAVRKFRSDSQRKSTLALADYPERYNVELIPNSSFLVVPEVSSERREYMPIGWLNPPTIPSNKLRAMINASLWHFGILTSRAHMAWLRYIGGKLKSDFQYGIGTVYNTFPWPDATETQREKISVLAQAVLDARSNHSNTTLAALYDRDLMKPDLRKAHQALDAAVDKLYRPISFTSDTDRVEHLFSLYEKLVAPLAIPLAKRSGNK